MSQWVDFERYRQLLGEFPEDQVSMYHREPWLDVLVSGFGAQIHAVCSMDEAGKLLALTPFMKKRKGPFVLLGSPLSGMYTEFAGPLFASGLEEEDKNRVLASQHQIVKRQGHYVEWGVQGGPAESGERIGRVLLEKGYEHTERPSTVVDLSPGEERVWKSFQGRARNMTRKSEKAGVVARSVAPEREWIESYYQMLSATFERQGKVVPHPISFYQSLQRLVESGEVLCVSAELEGRMIAAGIFLMDGSRMLYLSGTSNAEGLKLAGTSLLQWHAMKEAMAAGVTEYDMGGLGVASIDKFKRSFRGQDVAHHRWVFRSSLFRLVEPLAQWAASKGLIRVGS